MNNNFSTMKNNHSVSVSSIPTGRSPHYISMTVKNTRSFFEDNYDTLSGVNFTMLKTVCPTITRDEFIDTVTNSSELLRSSLLDLITVLHTCVESFSDEVFQSVMDLLISKETQEMIMESNLTKMDPNLTFWVVQNTIVNELNQLLERSGSPKNEDEHFALERDVMMIIFETNHVILGLHPDVDTSEMSYSELLSFHYRDQIRRVSDMSFTELLERGVVEQVVE